MMFYAVKCQSSCHHSWYQVAPGNRPQSQVQVTPGLVSGRPRVVRERLNCSILVAQSSAIAAVPQQAMQSHSSQRSTNRKKLPATWQSVEQQDIVHQNLKRNWSQLPLVKQPRGKKTAKWHPKLMMASHPEWLAQYGTSPRHGIMACVALTIPHLYILAKLHIPSWPHCWWGLWRGEKTCTASVS